MVDLAVLGLWLDSMISKVFSNPNDSMIPGEHTQHSHCSHHQPGAGQSSQPGTRGSTCREKIQALQHHAGDGQGSSRHGLRTVLLRCASAHAWGLLGQHLSPFLYRETTLCNNLSKLLLSVSATFLQHTVYTHRTNNPLFFQV